MAGSVPTVNVMHIIDKLSMDGTNPSSCTTLFGEWIPRLDADGFSTTVLSLPKLVALYRGTQERSEERTRAFCSQSSKQRDLQVPSAILFEKRNNDESS